MIECAPTASRRLAALAAALCLLPLLAGQAAAGRWPTLERPKPHGGGEKDAAFIAAVERYVFLPPIRGATTDAERWFEHLTTSRAVPVENVTLLRDEKVT